MTLTLTKGSAIEVEAELTTNRGMPVDLSPEAGVVALRACVQDERGSTSYIAETAQESAGADWRAGIVRIRFSAEQSESLPDGGRVRIGVTRYDSDGNGGEVAKMFWPIVARVQKGC